MPAPTSFHSLKLRSGRVEPRIFRIARAHQVVFTGAETVRKTIGIKGWPARSRRADFSFSAFFRAAPRSPYAPARPDIKDQHVRHVVRTPGD